MTHENVSVHITLSRAKQTKNMCPCTGHFQRSHVKAEKGRGGRAGGGGGREGRVRAAPREHIK